MRSIPRTIVRAIKILLVQILATSVVCAHFMVLALILSILMPETAQLWLLFGVFEATAIVVAVGATAVLLFFSEKIQNESCARQLRWALFKTPLSQLVLATIAGVKKAMRT